MDNAETPKVWYVTHDGQQFGPVSLDDLKFEAERGELNPRLDMVWKDGMEDWIPAGDLEGLFEKNKDAEAEEITKATAEPAIYVEPDPKEAKKTSSVPEGSWDGNRRRSYLFVVYVLPVLLVLGFSFGSVLLQGEVDQNLIAMAFGVLALINFIFAILVTVNRFTNLAMSRWWFLGLLVPILNIWVYYRLAACPAGYAEHKKLDPIGWVLAVIYWIPIVAALAAVGTMLYLSKTNPEKLKELTSGKEAQEFSEFMEKARERGKEIRESKMGEKQAPKPSITPY